MKRIIRSFTVAGGVIPIVLMCIKGAELYVNKQTVPYASLYGLYLWPSSILLLNSREEFTLTAILWLSISILINILVYFILGFLLASAAKAVNFANRKA